MSTSQAQALIRRTMEDDGFARRLLEAPVEERRGILEAEGYGDVRLAHIAAVLPQSVGGELADDEFAAAVGGAHTATAIGLAGGAWATGISIGLSVAASA
ncbi:MAG: hypothetical protein AAFY28_14495 [Actinomycetota bacterium]